MWVPGIISPSLNKPLFPFKALCYQLLKCNRSIYSKNKNHFVFSILFIQIKKIILVFFWMFKKEKIRNVTFENWICKYFFSNLCFVIQSDSKINLSNLWVAFEFIFSWASCLIYTYHRSMMKKVIIIKNTWFLQFNNTCIEGERFMRSI